MTQKKEKEKKEKDNKEKDKDIVKMEEEKEEDDDYFFDKSNKIKFTLFDYMWLFNPSAKNDIIFLFNENQQTSEIRKILTQDSERFRDRDFGFLNLFLNRKYFY